MASFADVKKWITGTRGTLSELRQSLQKLELRREDLRCLARPREELAELVCQHIDEIAAKHPARFAHSLHHLIHNPMGPRNAEPDDEGSVSQVPVCTTTGHNNTQATGKTVERALYYLLNEQIKAGARQAIAEMPYPDAVGPKMEDRLKEIAKVDQAIAELKEQIKVLESEISAALQP